MASMTSELIVRLVDMATGPARAISAQVESLERAQRANSRAMAEARGQMFDAAAMAISFAKAMGEPVQAAMAFESVMADVRKVTDFDDAGLAEFGSELREMAANDIPMAVNELAELAASAAAAGVDDADLTPFTRMTAEAAVAWGMAGGAAGDNLAKIRAALGLTIGETQLYSDAVNHLSDNTASTAQDLVDYGRRVAAQGEFYGYGREETLAFGSAMIGTGAQAEVAATSFRNMGRALTRGASATTRQKNAFKALGLDAAGVAQAMQEDAVATTLLVIDRLGQLPEHLQASMISDIFGDEARALAPLLNNLDLLRDTLGLVGDEAAYAGSVAREFAVRASTTEFAAQRWKNQLNEIALAIGNALLPALNSFFEVTGPWLVELGEWISANERLAVAIIGLTGGMVALRVATAATRYVMLFFKGGLIDLALFSARAAGALLALLNPMNLVRGALLALRLAVISTGVGALVAAIAMAGVWIYNNWEPLSAFFTGLWEGFASAIQPIMPALQPILDWVQSAVDWFSQLLGPIEATDAEARSLGEAIGTGIGEAVMAVLEWFAKIPEHLQTAIGWVSDLGAGLRSLVVNFDIGTIPEFIAWLRDIYVSGLMAAVRFLWPEAEPWVQWLIDLAAGLINFNLANLFQWPRPPDWVMWLIEGGSSLIGGWLGGEEIPGQAVGGAVAGGRTYLVGEEGPELFTPGGQGYISTATETAGMLGGRSSQLNINTPLIGSVQVTREADVDAVIQRIEQKLRDMMSGLHADLEYAG